MVARGYVFKRQEGFATTLTAVLLLLILGAIIAACYLLYRQQHNTLTPAASNTSSSNSSRATSPAVASCTTPHLKLSISNQSGTAGTMYMNADLTNIGSTACTLTGYPTVFLANGSGSTTGMGAEPTSDYPPVVITLAAGAVAHTLLAFPDAGNFATPGICSGPSANLYVYPPASTTYLQTPLVQQACPGFRATALKIGV